MPLWRVDGTLKLDIQDIDADVTSSHRRQHLNVAQRVKSEFTRDARRHEVDDVAYGEVRGFRGEKEHVRRLASRTENGEFAAIDPVCIDDDVTPGCLSVNLSEANRWDAPRPENVMQNLAGTNRWQLIRVAN